MGRQYSSNKRSSRQKGGAPQQFLIVIVTFMLGYLTATVFNAEKLTNWLSTQVLEHSQEKKRPPKAEVQQAQQTQVPPKPKFEFYTLLANEKAGGSTNQASVNAAANRPANHSTPAASATRVASTAAVAAATVRPVPKPVQQHAPVNAVTTAKAPIINTTQANRGNYLIQVAAFKVRQDAEHMKGMLILKGFSVSVVPITHQAKGVWYRVVVGPYANRVLAQRAQETLARNERLRGMVTSG